MAQFLRPIATTLSSRIATGDHTSIDEAVPDDGDYIRTQNIYPGGAAAVFECRLSPALQPRSPNATLRLRSYDPQPYGSYMTLSLKQGAQQLWTAEYDPPGIGIRTAEVSPDISGVTDWSDLSFRCEFYLPGWQTPGGARNVYLYWLELEIPDRVPASLLMLL
ncbi:hypothetical protein [Altericroceibacterium endophyticum]|uniref:Uncharacterized protein n=1 Tax=Altericroceibacterium endophyticum TaxID=1808508 RepID=A0A6I4T5T5_9SPHN|nr:hypothetical protein [Altericroceibacterium endophyticum]MXO66256.1 hypothetical protein [Altericroceibacterium endophyticum]